MPKKRHFIRNGIRICGLILGAATLSACAYDGYGGGTNYRSSYYDCDPYASWSSYYSCDSGYGFANIGYGGGWYDNYYYPGHGLYLFDQRGSRHQMNGNYRRYWAQQRFNYQRSHRDNRNHRRYYDNDRNWRDRDGHRYRPRDRNRDDRWDRNRRYDRKDEDRWNKRRDRDRDRNYTRPHRKDRDNAKRNRKDRSDKPNRNMKQKWLNNRDKD